jgi:hypothetical protein
VSVHADRLALMDSAYDVAPVADGGQAPDGEYQAIIDRFDFIESPKNGKLYLKTFARIAAGPFEGKPLTTLHALEDPERFGLLKKHLSVLECEPASLRNLEAELDKALDCPFLVAVRTKTVADQVYRNVYFNQKLGGPIRRVLTDVPATAAASAIDADIPF